MLSLAAASDLVRRKKVSPVDLTRSCLGRVERLNPRLNAFITVLADQARFGGAERLGKMRGDRGKKVVTAGAS